MSISGTSMATPHVGGMAGILLDVAPSLGAADYHRDDHDFGDSLVGGDGTAAYGQFEDWNERNNSRVHEVELILELTARYEGMANACEGGTTKIPATTFQRNATAVQPASATTGASATALQMSTQRSPSLAPFS